MPRVMFGERCELTTRRSVQAFYAEGFLVIEAAGVLPRSGDRAEILEISEPGGDARFGVMRCFGFSVQPKVEVPFVHKEIFAMAARPAVVEVQHSEGSDRVEVEDAGADLAAFVLSLPTVGTLHYDSESTGYSRSMAFDEALGDALSRLAAVPAGESGQTHRITVLDTGALVGGGLCHLFVKVRRERD